MHSYVQWWASISNNPVQYPVVGWLHTQLLTAVNPSTVTQLEPVSPGFSWDGTAWQLLEPNNLPAPCFGTLVERFWQSNETE